MAYLKLSEQLQKLSTPQHSDVVVKQFRIAVREGQFEAVELPGARFELPKEFKRRGEGGGTYRKAARDMLFEATPEVDAWFAQLDTQLAQGRQSARLSSLSVESIESGAVDFRALAAATRQKLEVSHLKGQKLGTTSKRKNKGLHRK